MLCIYGWISTQCYDADIYTIDNNINWLVPTNYITVAQHFSGQPSLGSKLDRENHIWKLHRTKGGERPLNSVWLLINDSHMQRMGE